MVPPFTMDEFFQVFVVYNTAVWPTQILLFGAATLCVVLAFRSERWAGKVILFTLAALWAWMAVAYHWAFFAEINPAASIFGALFLLEAALLLWIAFRTEDLRLAPGPDLFGVAGGIFIVYALVVYRLVGMTLGHHYPAQPMFGLPCPTTIFTVGMLIWLNPKVPLGPLIVPLEWSVVGMTAVLYFGVLEDTMLPIATISAAVLILIKNRKARRAIA